MSLSHQWVWSRRILQETLILLILSLTYMAGQGMCEYEWIALKCCFCWASCHMAQTKRRPLGEIKSLTTRALSTWGVEEQRNWTNVQKVWRTVTPGLTPPPKSFTQSLLASDQDTPPGWQWLSQSLKVRRPLCMWRDSSVVTVRVYLRNVFHFAWPRL